MVFCTDASVSVMPGSRGAAFEGFSAPFRWGSVATGGDMVDQCLISKILINVIKVDWKPNRKIDVG